MSFLCCRFSPLQQQPNCLKMSLYLTTMLSLPLNHLDGGRTARIHNISLRSHAPGNANTQLLSVQSSPAVLKATPLHRTHIATIVNAKLCSPAGYRYRIIKAVSRARNTMCRLLGNGTPPRPRVQERATTTPTTWYCHQCNDGPYNITAQPRCTNVINGRQCDHSRCGYCKEE